MKKKGAFILLVVLCIIAAIVILSLLTWRLPTRVSLNLTVNKLNFKPGGDDKTQILDSVGLQAINIEKFKSIRLTPESVNIESPAKSKTSARGSNISREALAASRTSVLITSRDEKYQPNVTLTRLGAGDHSFIVIDKVWANPNSEVILEKSGDDDDLTITLAQQHSSGKITAADPIRVITNQCQVSGVGNYPNGTQSSALRVKLQQGSAVEFDGQSDSFTLTLTVPKEKITYLFPKGVIPVKSISFNRQNEDTGKIETSVVKAGEISYPGYEEKIKKVTIKPTDYINLDGLEKFNIEVLAVSDDSRSISLELEGVVNKITTGVKDYPQDRRITVYDYVWNNHYIVALFGAVCWVIGVFIAAYKLYKGD